MHIKKIIVLGILSMLVLVGMSAFKNKQLRYWNLQILPRDIDNRSLEKLMDDFNRALNVKCNHCHAPLKDNPQQLDFVSDTDPDKNEARRMMRLTMDINARHWGDTSKVMSARQTITCMTCHNGMEIPK